MKHLKDMIFVNLEIFINLLLNYKLVLTIFNYLNHLQVEDNDSLTNEENELMKSEISPDHSQIIRAVDEASMKIIKDEMDEKDVNKKVAEAEERKRREMEMKEKLKDEAAIEERKRFEAEQRRTALEKQEAERAKKEMDLNERRVLEEKRKLEEEKRKQEAEATRRKLEAETLRQENEKRLALEREEHEEMAHRKQQEDLIKQQTRRDSATTAGIISYFSSDRYLLIAQ